MECYEITEGNKKQKLAGSSQQSATDHEEHNFYSERCYSSVC